MRRSLAVTVLTLMMAAGAAIVPTVAVAGPPAAFIAVTPVKGGPGTPLQIEGNCGTATIGIPVFVAFEINGNSITLDETITDDTGAFSLNPPAPQIAPPVIVPGNGEIIALCDEGVDSVRVTTPFELEDSLLGLTDPSRALEIDPRFTG